MARNGSGIYSLPDTYEAVSGETIEAQQHNDPLEDLAADANDARPLVAGGTGGTSAVEAIDNLLTKGGNTASASTVDLSSVSGYFVHITGTTTITALGTASAGVVRTLVFDSSLTLTHNDTSLILPGGENIITSAGDCAVMVSEGSGNWRCISYSPAVWKAITGWTNISGSPASLDFVGLTQGRYAIEVDGARPVTDDCRFSANVQTGGSTWQTSGHAYGALICGPGGSSAGYGSTPDSLTASIGLSQVAGSGIGVGNAAGEGWSGRIEFDTVGTLLKGFDFRGHWLRPNSTIIGVIGSGVYGAAVDITGFRLFWSSGNFANVGRYRLLKIRE